MFGPPGLILIFSSAPLKNRKTPLSYLIAYENCMPEKMAVKNGRSCQYGMLPKWQCVKKACFSRLKNIFPIGTGCALYIGIESNPQRIEKMNPAISTNNFIASLPRIRRRRIWNVVIDGKVVQGVSATDNRRSSAEAYIANKYPGQVFTLVFMEWRT